MNSFEYPLTLTPDKKGGGYVVTIRDFPEASTQGDSLEDALTQGEDALDEAIANRIMMQLEVPAPSSPGSGDYLAVLPASTALKAAFYIAIKELSLSKVQLAALLGVDEKEIRRLLDPRHSSKLTRIEELLLRLGRRIRIQVADTRMPAYTKHEKASFGLTLGEIWKADKPKPGLYLMPARQQAIEDLAMDEIAS